MGPPRDLAIRPLGLGEIIDRSVALTLRHFRTLFAAMLVIEASALALGRLQQARAGEVLALLGDPARATAAFPSLTGFFGALLLALLVLQLAATAAAAAIVAPSLDPAAPPGPSGLRRALAVVTATIVQVAALVLAPAFGALPGLLLAARAETFATQVVAIVAAALGAVVLFLLVLLRLVLVPAVAAVEGRGAFRAALRSARLMAPARGGRFLDRPALRASLVLLAIFLLAGGEGPVGLLGATLPLPLEVAISIFEAAAAAALQPFSLVAVAVFYFDRRARTEALDVEIWAARLEGGR